jgi:V8-like Glu-specific endopeptidase
MAKRTARKSASRKSASRKSARRRSAARRAVTRAPEKPEAPPLSARELYNRELFRNPTKQMPGNVRAALLLPEIEPFEVTTVDRRALARYSGDPIKPHAPEWLAVTAKPMKDLFAGRSRARVRYRGIELEPLWVLGADDRRTYYDTNYPWRCVCKINTRAGSGSGVIVGPRHVLTASHVVNWAAASGVEGSVDVLRAGALVSATSRIVRVHAFTRVTGGIDWHELDEDYAVLVTADRIGDWFGWLGTRTYNSSWDGDPYWFNIGYPGDLGGGNFPIFQNGRNLDEHALDFGGGRAMDTNADTFFGQSGGPMAAFWDDGPYAVAVVSAQSRGGDRENYCSGGGDLPRLVRRARELDT